MRTVPTLALAVFLVGLVAYGQDTKPRTNRLPYGWSKIVTDTQKKAALKIIAQANVKIAELQRQIDTIKAKERADLNALLTDDQRQALRKLAEQRSGVETPTKENPKTDGKK